jgi:hypothetical protein
MNDIGNENITTSGEVSNVLVNDRWLIAQATTSNIILTQSSTNANITLTHLLVRLTLLFWYCCW